MHVEHVKPPAIEFVHIGGPTTVIQIDGLRFITDPTFDPAGGEYATAPTVTLKKVRGPAIEMKDIGSIDVALVTHDQHADNLDNSGRELLKKIPKVFTTEIGASRLKSGVIGLKPWETRTLKTPHGNTIRITATPARHGPALIEKLAGDVIGFVLTWEEKELDLVYVTGDTVWYSGVAEVAKRFQPKAVLLFTGAARTRGPFYMTMNANDAIETATTFVNAEIIPVHCDGWAHFTQGVDDLKLAFSVLGLESRLRIPSPGEKLRLQP